MVALAVVAAPTTTGAGNAERAGGATRWTFDPGPGDDTEVSLAVDPKNPRRVLVAWQEDIRRVWSAVTADGGRRWIVRHLLDPTALVNSQERDQQAFDPTAAIGPDGTLYVLMGGVASPVPAVSRIGGITLARSTNGGRWEFLHVDPVGVTGGWDYANLAVAPDTGRLYVVAQSSFNKGIGFWRSSDRGRSWTPTRYPYLETAAGVRQLSADGFEYAPRVAAGAGGHVLLVTKAALGLLSTIVSRDGGGTFLPGPRLVSYAPGLDFTGTPATFDGRVAVAGYVLPPHVVVLRSLSAVQPWRSVSSPPNETMGTVYWSTLAARNGVTWVLHTEQRKGPLWSVHLTKQVGRSFTTRVLARVAARGPRGTDAGDGPRQGDEYGGLAVAADGSVWVAWSQPRVPGADPGVEELLGRRTSTSPVITVVRLQRP